MYLVRSLQELIITIVVQIVVEQDAVMVVWPLLHVRSDVPGEVEVQYQAVFVSKPRPNSSFVSEHMYC